ncbi:MAG: hypothetical protein IPO24_19050 [Bacteroidetes bacterium]|nr:hypothetical protein [Bacteroidota bacterium]
MKKALLAVASTFIYAFTTAQSTSDYQRVLNVGTLPSEVYTPSTEKYQSEIANIEADLTKSEQNSTAILFGKRIFNR